jgi:4-hydroxy-3-methylbut-2-enyl diphosphate reductase
VNVVRAKILGFCMGVRRAVEMANAELSVDLADPASVYTLGPLIHNPQTLDSLKKRGVRILDESRDTWPPIKTEKPVVIIRAHGVSPAIEEDLGKSFRIADATCPRVKASQNAARRLAEQGYRIFLAGEKNHAEVKGIAGYIEAAGGTCVIVGDAAEAAAAAGGAVTAAGVAVADAKTALIAQTTFSVEEYAAVASALKKRFPNLEVKATICGATRERQSAWQEVCAAVDAVNIAGGRDSANTRRLLAIAESGGKPAWLAESAADVPDEAGAYKTVGLCAGASTPDSVIDEIVQALLLLDC